MQRKKRPLAPRGFDFLARWSQGSWAESKVIEMIDYSGYLAVPYGPSRGDPIERDFSGWTRFFEEYQRRLETQGKRPDLLVFERSVSKNNEAVYKLQDMDDRSSGQIASSCIVALEVETSLWKAKKALLSGTELSFTIKEEDMERLTQWQRTYKKRLLIVQVFYDSAYAISYDTIKESIAHGVTKKAKKDRKTGKLTFKTPLSIGVEFALLVEPPSVSSTVLESDKGMIMAYASFRGGRFNLTPQGLGLLRST
jgi:hypothetical protein